MKTTKASKKAPKTAPKKVAKKGKSKRVTLAEDIMADLDDQLGYIDYDGEGNLIHVDKAFRD